MVVSLGTGGYLGGRHRLDSVAIPWTRALATQILRLPFQLLLIWFITGLLIRLGDALLNRLAKVWDKYDFLAAAMPSGKRCGSRLPFSR